MATRDASNLIYMERKKKTFMPRRNLFETIQLSSEIVSRASSVMKYELALNILFHTLTEEQEKLSLN